ncbi:MAG: hypothetical protein AAF484_01825 [Pseudomonadota bacterium]
MKSSGVVFLGSVILLGACAQQPANIDPIPVGEAYVSTKCAEAQQMLVSERELLDELSKQQETTAAGDAMGVFLIGVPVSSVYGEDVSAEIATSKGKVMALEARVTSC